MDKSGEGEMIISWSGEVQVRVKPQKYSELDMAELDIALLSKTCLDKSEVDISLSCVKLYWILWKLHV